MKTIAITLDDEIVQAVDTMTKNLNTSWSAFAQDALQLALQREYIEEMEKQHRQGYLKHPVQGDEFSDWEDEQVWGD